MHKAIVEKLVRSKILFFDSNPIGRIFTRFSKDVTVLDLVLPGMASMATFTVFRSISVFIMVTVIYPYMLFVVFFALGIMCLILRKGVAPSRECLRMDSLYRGPIHSQFAMIVNGLVSLRTYERVAFFRANFMNELEKSSNVTFCYYGINRWMGMSLDTICLCFSLCASCFALFAKGTLPTEVLSFSL